MLKCKETRFLKGQTRFLSGYKQETGFLHQFVLGYLNTYAKLQVEKRLILGVAGSWKKS